MPEVSVKGRITTIIGAEQRIGFCEDCGTPTEKIMVDVISVTGREKRVKRPRCPKCGGEGRLIVRHISIQPPTPPACLSPRCIFRFIFDSLFSMLLASYHARRVHYATVNRNKDILERYRTGFPNPQNIWQAIHANIKLKCPVCRKYNVDPFLFRR